MTTGYRYLVCIPDGAAEQPIAHLGCRTPQRAADMPVLSSLAGHGYEGWARTVPHGMAPASDVGIMAVLGYDPALYHTGRAPLEAAGLGVELAPHQSVFRANLVTVDDMGTLVDFTGGHPSASEARDAMNRLQQHMGGDVTFHPGLGYRNLMTGPLAWSDTRCVPPHEAVGIKVPHPTGPASAHLTRVMEQSRDVLSGSSTSANQIWLWGQGPPTRLPDFERRFGVRGSLVAAVQVARGLGRLMGLDVPEVPGATGWYDTDYAAKREAAIAAYVSGAELVVVHVAATDEAGHAGDIAAKVAALERWDRLVLHGLVDHLDRSGPWRLLWMADHETSCLDRAHTERPVPYVVFDSTRRPLHGVEHAADAPIPAHHLMPVLLGG